MTRQAMRAALGRAVAVALCAVLTACGGGGGGDGNQANNGNNANNGAVPTNNSGTDTTSGTGTSTGTNGSSGSGSGSTSTSTSTQNPEATGSWSVTKLGIHTDMLFPGNTYQPIGGEYPYALWLGPDGAGGEALYRADAADTLLGTQTLQPALPQQAASNRSIAVTAGAWSMTVWAESETWQASTGVGPGLYVRVKGPNTDTGAVRVSDSGRVDPSATLPVIDASGHARLIWDDDLNSVNFRFGRNVLLSGSQWVEQKDLGIQVALYYRRLLMAPNGEGWLVLPQFVAGEPGANGRYEHRAYPLTAANGLGTPLRLEQTGSLWASAYGMVLASADGNNLVNMTMATQQASADGTTQCVLVGRVVGGALASTTCIPTSGDAVPNHQFMSLSTAAGGQGLLVWSTGSGPAALYASRRNAAGVWNAPVKLADLPSTSEWNALTGLRTAMGPQGQALVVWRVRPDGGIGQVHARTAVDGGAWSPDATLVQTSPTPVESMDVAVAFNNRGVPGVLQLTISGTAATGGSHWAIVMSSWFDGQWVTRPVVNDIQPAYINGVPLSLMRLAPSMTGGWLALWNQGLGTSDTTGYRELWAGIFH